MKKQKLLIWTDDQNWNYSSTVAAVQPLLEKHFEVHRADVAWQLHQLVKDGHKDFDLVWARCGGHRCYDLWNYLPHLRKKTLVSITTGGELLHERIRVNFAAGEVLGYIVQNQSARHAVKVHMSINNMQERPVYILPNGVDVETFRPASKPPDTFTVGFAASNQRGQEDYIKGYTHYFLPACKALGVDVFVCQNSAKHQVPHFQMPDAYRQMSVLLQPSHSEGHSNTINEAMASGLPVICTKVGYHGEVCDDQENIFFVQRDLGQIMAAIELLKSRHGLYRRMSINARKWAETHSWKVMAELYAKVFTQAMEAAK